MLTVAFALVDRWTHQLLDQWRSGERSADLRQSLATVGIVCAVTLWKGLAVAVAVGTGLALLQFVRAMNRSLLRSICTAADRPSRRLYPPAQEAALQALRSRIAVIELEGALLRGLDATQAATLRAAMRRRTLAAGELLFRQGDPADGLYLLTRGSITITAGSGADPAQRRYVSFSAGHMLGETAMLDGGARSASATADGPVELLHLPGEALDGLNRREPVLASQVHRNIAVHLSERLRHATRLSQIAPISGR
jgi:CRP-like cAMP-binding protein